MVYPKGPINKNLSCPIFSSLPHCAPGLSEPPSSWNWGCEVGSASSPWGRTLGRGKMRKRELWLQSWQHLQADPTPGRLWGFG